MKSAHAAGARHGSRSAHRLRGSKLAVANQRHAAARLGESWRAQAHHDSRRASFMRHRNLLRLTLGLLRD